MASDHNVFARAHDRNSHDETRGDVRPRFHARRGDPRAPHGASPPRRQEVRLAPPAGWPFYAKLYTFSTRVKAAPSIPTRRSRPRRSGDARRRRRDADLASKASRAPSRVRICPARDETRLSAARRRRPARPFPHPRALAFGIFHPPDRARHLRAPRAPAPASPRADTTRAPIVSVHRHPAARSPRSPAPRPTHHARPAPSDRRDIFAM